MRFATLVVVVIGTLLCALSASAMTFKGKSGGLETGIIPGVLGSIVARDPIDLVEELYYDQNNKQRTFTPGIGVERGLVMTTSWVPDHGVGPIRMIQFLLDEVDLGTDYVWMPGRNKRVPQTFLCDPPLPGQDQELWWRAAYDNALLGLGPNFWAFATRGAPYKCMINTRGLDVGGHLLRVVVRVEEKGRLLDAIGKFPFRVVQARDSETLEVLDLNDEPVNGGSRLVDGPGFYGRSEVKGVRFDLQPDGTMQQVDPVTEEPIGEPVQAPTPRSEMSVQRLPIQTQEEPQINEPACTCKGEFLRGLHEWLRGKGHAFECAKIVGTHELTLPPGEGPAVIYARFRNDKPIRPVKIEDPDGVLCEQFVTLIAREGQPASPADLAGAEEVETGKGYSIFKDADRRCWLVRESEVLGRLDFCRDDGNKTPVGVLYYHQGVDMEGGDKLAFYDDLPTRGGTQGPTVPVPEGGALVVLACDAQGKPIKPQ